MLKIKSNVDFKELEKYGFVKVKKGETEFVSKVKYWYSEDKNEWDCLTVFDDRELYVGIDAGINTYDKLYDLIKDGLVEKVED